MSDPKFHVGPATPESSAIFQIDSTTQGALFPRMTEAERDAIASPATGLTIYNLDAGRYEAYNGSAWVGVGGVVAASDTAYTPTTPADWVEGEPDDTAEALDTLAARAGGDPAPTITDFTDAQHDHLDATGGGTLSAAAIASGALAHERGGLEADVSAYDGFPFITGGATSQKKANLAATAAPATGDDSGDGYSIGSLWIDTTNDNVYQCVDATLGAAVWRQLNNVAAATQYSTINFLIDGGGSAITTGIKGDVVVDFACTIVGATLLADQSGDIVIDVWKDTYANFAPTDADSITASAPPTLSAATKSQDTTLTGWTTSVSAGDILRFNVDSASTVTRVTLALKVQV
jgi:hypothetical protein